MKLYEIIFTCDYSKEVYKDYRYFKSAKACKEYVLQYGMDIVRIKKVDNEIFMPDEIIHSAEQELAERMMED